MSGNIDEKKIYELHSFTNAQEAWKVVGAAEWGGLEESLFFLDDRKFKEAVTEKIIISLGLAKTAKISYDDAREFLGFGVDKISHLTNFNFFLYSDKNKKFYTSIVGDGAYYDSEIKVDEWYEVYKELHETYHFEELVAKGIEFVQTNLSLFGNPDKEKVMDELLEKFWNEPDL